MPRTNESVSNRTPHRIVIDGIGYDPVSTPIRIAPPATEEVDNLPWPAVKAMPFDERQVLAACQEICDDPSYWVIVPRMVLEAIQDVYEETVASVCSEALLKAVAPDTSPGQDVRDENNNIVGVKRVVVKR